jgi:hypothetical protein
MAKTKFILRIVIMIKILFGILFGLELILLVLVLTQIFRRDFHIWPPHIEQPAITHWALGIFYILILGSIWFCVLEWNNSLFDQNWIRYFGGMLLSSGLVFYIWCGMYMSKMV